MKDSNLRDVSDALVSNQAHLTTLAIFLEERVGFEPTGRYGPPVFKTGALSHSATSPYGDPREIRTLMSCDAGF